MKSKIFFLLVAISIFGCKNKSDKITVVKTKNQSIKTDTTLKLKDSTIKTDTSLPKFPDTGKKITDFVYSPYEIKMEATGFLNDDNLKDVVIVLQNTQDNTDSRPTLVLIKQATGEYKLQEISWQALEPEFMQEYGKVYDYEEVSIADKKIHITLQSTGPIGTRETIYQYLNNQLVLVGIRTFNMGAGSQLSKNYNLVSGQADIEVINTMIDSMPSTQQIKNFKLPRKMLFVKDNPNTVLEKLPEAEDW